MRLFRFDGSASVRFVILLLIMALICVCKNTNTGLDGRTRLVDGITVIENPAEPLFQDAVVEFEEDLDIDEDTGSGEILIYKIQAFDVDEKGRIIVLDSEANQVLVFDERGNFLYKFGRKGQGPGELEHPINLSVNKSEILVQDGLYSGNLSRFNIEGEFLTRIPLQSWSFDIAMDSRGDFLLTSSSIIQSGNTQILIAKYNRDMDVLWELDQILESPEQLKIKAFSARPCFQVDRNDNIFYGRPEEYEVRLLTAEGTILKKIRREYEPVKITRDEIEERTKTPDSVKRELARAQVKMQYVVPENHPAYRRFLIDDDGLIFVETWEKSGSQYLFDVFDSQGRYIAQTTLPDGPRILKNGDLYCLAEDDDGYRSIKRYRVNWLSNE